MLNNIADSIKNVVKDTFCDNNVLLINADVFDVFEVLKPNMIDCIWTDPPYLLSNNGTTCISGKRVSVNKGKWDESKGVHEDHKFNTDWLRECYRILKLTGTIWVSGTIHVYLSIGMAIKELGYRILNDIIWVKKNPPPNLGCRCFTHSTETLLWAAKAPKGSEFKYTFNYKKMKAENHGKQMKNVWVFNAPSKNEKQFGKHPTQKPINLISRSLRASTKSGYIVFDPFMGSGTTGIAALLNDCFFIGVEREKKYYDLALKRIADASGNTSAITELKTPDGLKLF